MDGRAVIVGPSMFGVMHDPRMDYVVYIATEMAAMLGGWSVEKPIAL